MRKMLVVFAICLLVCGCRKTENNVTINVYENKDPEVKEEITEQKLDLNILTVTELRELAKKKEIKGYSKMKKEELIEILK